MTAAAELERVRHSAEYKAARKQLSDREWRLDHLYFIQDKDGNETLFKRNVAQMMLSTTMWYRDVIAKARQLGFCLDPSTRILTSDLKWVALSDVKVGQSIISVDENAPKLRGSARKMRRGIVEAVRDVFEESFALTIDDGTQLISTGPHRFMARRRGGVEPQWRTIETMVVGDVIRRVCSTWDEADYEDGWMGGLIDGEGSMRQKSAGGFELTVSQTPGAVLDRARSYLTKNGYLFREDVDSRPAGSNSKLGSKPLHKLVLHRSGEAMRLLGKCRPSRFIERSDWWEGRALPQGDVTWGKIVKIEALGKRRMIDIQTSERTFIAEGFVSHNSTFIAVLILDDCIFRAGTVAAIIDYKLADAKKKLAKIKYAYERLPRNIRSTVRLEKDNEEEIHFSNGSKISVGTSFRGDTPQILHVSEYGKISSDFPDVAKGIKTGAFNAVGLNGKIYVESTAHGVGGEFYDLVQRSDKVKKAGQPLTQLDFKLHFFAWWMDPKYTLQPNLVTLTAEMIKYFDEIAPILLQRYGKVLDAGQKAWYAKMFEEQGPDDMKSEYPSIVEECFHNSLEGSYFKRELARARAEQRIGLPMPYDPTRPVNTFWDIGMDDENCIWFHQWDGVRHRFIDFYSNSGEGLAHYVQVLREKRETRNFIYGKHYGPHDLEVREWTSKAAEPRWKVAEGLGVKFVVVPRIEDKADAIEAARRMIGLSYFDSIHCEYGVRCLDNYRKKWNERLSTWSSDPVHDWASHGADAYMTGAVGLVPEKAERSPRGHTHQSNSGRTAWSA